MIGTYAFCGLIGIILGYIVYFLFFKKKKALDTEIDTTITPGTNTTPIVTAPAANDSFPLQIGSKGSNVKYLQNALNKINPTYTIPADGAFGTQTKSFLLVTMGTAYYPVTSTLFSKILQKANQI